MTKGQLTVLQQVKPNMVWHQYHTYLCILESDPKLLASSNLGDIYNHPAYVGLVLMGDVILPFLKVDLVHGDKDWARMMLLRDFVPDDEQPHFPDEVAGRLDALWGIWREWALKDWL